MFEPTPHPVFRIPSAAEIAAMGRERALAVFRERERLIGLEKADPYRNVYDPGHWLEVDRSIARRRETFPGEVNLTLLLGGNRAGKSEYAAKKAIRLMVAKPGSRVWCLQSTQSASRQSQMPVLWGRSRD